MNILRSILGVIAGMVIGMIIFSAGQMINFVFYPPPANLDPREVEQLRLYFASLPTLGFVIVLATYFLAVFFASFAAAKIAGRAEVLHGFVIVMLCSLGAFMNFSMNPFPMWAMIGTFIAYFVAGFAGSSFAGSLRKARTT